MINNIAYYLKKQKTIQIIISGDDFEIKLKVQVKTNQCVGLKYGK